MTKDLFDKYIWLVDTIYRAGKITLEEINKRWMRSQLSEGTSLPHRTFHNWRNAIEQVFDINIECDRTAGYYYYIENADDMEKGGIRNWLLNTFAVNNLINESHHLKRRILFENIPSGRQFLTPIIEAMRDGLEVNMLHQSYWRDTPTLYTVQPYCIKCKERNDMRTFSLDRIQQLTTLDNHFTYPKNFDPDTYFADYFGIITDDEIDVEPVRIKVFGKQRLYVRALPLHHSQKEAEITDTYSVFEYHIKPTLDFEQEILSRGTDMEVLAPLWLRENIAETIHKMSLKYPND